MRDIIEEDEDGLAEHEEDFESCDDIEPDYLPPSISSLGLQALSGVGRECMVAEGYRERFISRNQDMIDDCFIDLLTYHPEFSTTRFWLDNKSKTDEQIIDLLLEQPSEEVVRRNDLYSKLPELSGWTDNQKSFANSIRLNMLDCLPDSEVNQALIDKMNENPNTCESDFWINIRDFKPDNMKKFAVGETDYKKHMQKKKQKKQEKHQKNLEERRRKY